MSPREIRLSVTPGTRLHQRAMAEIRGALQRPVEVEMPKRAPIEEWARSFEEMDIQARRPR